MIAGIFLRNFKSFRNQQYVPIYLDSNASYLIGENGVGKSSILAAIDTVLNHSDINKLDINNDIRSLGFDTREPFIVPLFLIEKEKVKRLTSTLKTFEIISNITWQIESDDFNLKQRPLAEKFVEHRNILSQKYNEKTHYLIPIGIIKNGPNETPVASMSIFESIDDYNEQLQELIESTPLSTKIKKFGQLVGMRRTLDQIKELYNYIYIPAEITVDSYSKIEGELLQALLGENLHNRISKTIRKKDISDINTQLNEYIDGIAKLLDNTYHFKKPSKRQTQFTQRHMIMKITETFFSDKILHRRVDNRDTPINNLSSGEKRGALLDLATAFLKSNPTRTSKYTIFCIDEPELSLHASACFKQFEKIKKISEMGIQSLVTTHWYGFLPAIGNGTAIYISPNQEFIKSINLRHYKEEMKLLAAESKGSYFDILEVKSNHDLVQSIIASISSSNSYNWILCEGKTDKKYIETHLKYEGLSEVIVLPVGGSITLKDIYSYLILALKDRKKTVSGKVYCVLDTDAKHETFHSSDSVPNIIIRRLMLTEDRDEVKLIKTTDNQVSPPTEIEDALDGEFYYETLLHLSKNDDNSRFDFMDGIQKLDSNVSGGFLDLTATQQKIIKQYFDEPGKKNEFCDVYCNLVDTVDEIRTPQWLYEITEFFSDDDSLL